MRTLGLVAALAVLSSSSVAAAQDIGDPEEGLEFAKSVCAECHAVEARGSSRNPGAPTFRRIAAEPGMTAMALSVILHNTHRKMPDLVISPTDRANVIAYILTLKPPR